jgi:probable rRNA maturation factor
LSIEINNESGLDVDETGIADVARFAMEQMKVHPLTELSIILVDTEAMSALHEEWMDEEGPTDVLSFPMDELRPGSWRGAEHHEEDELPILGDIVLCPSVAAAQADTAGHSAADELHLLTVHGVLHLLGYDHAEPEEEREMFRLQGELLEQWKVAQ